MLLIQTGCCLQNGQVNVERNCRGLRSTAWLATIHCSSSRASTLLQESAIIMLTCYKRLCQHELQLAVGSTVGQHCSLGAMLSQVAVHPSCSATWDLQLLSALVPCQRLLAWTAWMGLQHTRLSRKAQSGAQRPPYLGYGARTALQTPLDLYATARKKVMTQFASSSNST